ncbi:hypothetical protein Glove_294g139 [Diversispora epigaea]|uniref:Uncharacterized protein n=1 Tax=Diversispora epigaea TaxID=1348612 RepID=A0A397HZJ6_9GLOM|nr:hypothetical protein Glove_294g139 [Diversispora epigaea]
MSENDKFKKWFKILFNAFHQEETVIEFPHDSYPPKEFLDIVSPNKSKSIKCIENVIYWSKVDEPEIIQQAINYIEDHFVLLDTTKNDHDEQWQAFKDKENVLNKQEKMEWELQKDILENIDDFVPGFKFLHKYEWMPSPNNHKGGINDFILTNGKGIFAIVETKRVDKSKEKKSRKFKVIEQATRYKQAFVEQRLQEPDVIAIVAVGITDESLKKRYWSGLYDENVFRAFNIKYGNGDFPEPVNKGLFYASANSSSSSINFLSN